MPDAIDQSDFALMCAVDLDDWQVYLLAAENAADIMNAPAHELGRDALFEHFLKLWRIGLIECSLELPFQATPPNPELVHAQFDPMPQDTPPEEQILLYRLT